MEDFELDEEFTENRIEYMKRAYPDAQHCVEYYPIFEELSPKCKYCKYCGFCSSLGGGVK